uniref:Uncharacterized protein n=1 Tax=Anguilla anguilla TaxID=7936 RepID=A0A0E9W4Z6_ANGAN
MYFVKARLPYAHPTFLSSLDSNLISFLSLICRSFMSV